MSSNTGESIAPDATVLWDTGHHGHDMISTRTFGFWLYMLSDAMIFAALFTAYAVLGHNYAGGPSATQILRPGDALAETMLVFTSVLAFGFSMSALKRGHRAGVLNWIAVAFVLGAAFVGMEVHEFANLASRGIVPERSGFLSAYYTIVLTHGLHMVFGLLWMAVMAVQVLREGFTDDIVYRLLNLRIFWHFQAIIWVCVFTFIYLQGSL
ncbi:MAG: cytochrome c oxidase subunit 3 [Gammaproteobacteria bacterium]|jgi:cytochrome o ubiquinol oxidase subunit III